MSVSTPGKGLWRRYLLTVIKICTTVTNTIHIHNVAKLYKCDFYDLFKVIYILTLMLWFIKFQANKHHGDGNEMQITRINLLPISDIHVVQDDNMVTNTIHIHNVAKLYKCDFYDLFKVIYILTLMLTRYVSHTLIMNNTSYRWLSHI
jgi:hypothetical protein